MEKVSPLVHGSPEELNQDHIDAAIDDVHFRMEVISVANRLKNSKNLKDIEVYDLCREIIYRKPSMDDPLVQIFRRLRDEKNFQNGNGRQMPGISGQKSETNSAITHPEIEKPMPNPSDIDSDGNPTGAV